MGVPTGWATRNDPGPPVVMVPAIDRRHRLPVAADGLGHPGMTPAARSL